MQSAHILFPANVCFMQLQQYFYYGKSFAFIIISEYYVIETMLPTRLFVCIYSWVTWKFQDLLALIKNIETLDFVCRKTIYGC